MMTFLIVLLTIALVADCLFLMLLVLIQLPKKEAGAGLAFGGGATDALFGAGAGNALTNLTKWSAAIFFALSLVLSVLNSHHAAPGSGLKELYNEKPAPGSTTTPPPVTTPSAKPATTGTNLEVPLLTNTAGAATNAAPAAPTTNTPPK